MGFAILFKFVTITCVTRDRGITWSGVSVRVSSVAGASGPVGLLAGCGGVAVVVLLFPILTDNQSSLSRPLAYLRSIWCLGCGGLGF